MKVHDTTDIRHQTILFWSTYKYPNNPIDIRRVEAFRELDSTTATDLDVSIAYGNDGWIPIPVCDECGSRDARLVTFGPNNKIVICEHCLEKTNDLLNQNKKTTLFSRIFGGKNGN